MKYLSILIILFLLGCSEPEYHSGYVIEVRYSECRGNITIINNSPYCNNRPLHCHVTVGDWINGEFVQHVNNYSSEICSMIKYNDYIP